MKDYTGQIFSTYKNGDIEVVKFLGYRFERQQEYEVRFLNTGTVVPALISAIKKGQVKDPMVPTIAGVGYIGLGRNIAVGEIERRLYRIWANILHRCYDVKDIGYKAYGARGVTVSDEWHCYINFRQDIEQLPGWELDKFTNKEIQVDKDSRTPGSLLYSKDTCCWLTRVEQAKFMRREVSKFVVVWPDGSELYWDKGTRAFCQAYPRFKESSVRMVLTGKRNTIFGCKIIRADEEPVTTIETDESHGVE